MLKTIVQRSAARLGSRIRAQRSLVNTRAMNLHREPSTLVPGRTPMLLSPEDALARYLRNGHEVWVHGAAATPTPLLKAMANVAQAQDLRQICVHHIHIEGDAPHADPALSRNFRARNLFVGPNMRKAVNDGRADYSPVFLGQIPRFLETYEKGIDIALIQVSPPDAHGYCTLGPSVECTRAAVQVAKRIVALVNPNLPRTNGDTIVHESQIDCLVDVEHRIPTHEHIMPNAVQSRIGSLIAEHFVKDGATLQMGIGAIPDAVLNALGDHHNLGVHTEMFSDGLMRLIEKGVITNHNKQFYRGKTVTTFAMGSQKLYDYLDGNPSIALLDVRDTNDILKIARNPNVTAINSCIEVDLTGQIAADTIGSRHYSGVGGSLDFLLGASLAKGGCPIIAMPSLASNGDSRISARLKFGASVTTTRAHSPIIVTEYGIANLFGKTLKERARALIEIAHPDHRERLEREAVEELNLNVLGHSYD